MRHTENIDQVDIYTIWNEINTPLPPARGEEERLALLEERQDKKIELLELASEQATRAVTQQQHDIAIPGAQLCIKIATELFGSDHLKLTDFYLTLAKSYLCKGRFNMAEKYLQMTRWNIFKNPQADHLQRSQMLRVFGKFFASQGKYEEALRHLAEDVYTSSLEVGPEHVHTAVGFYFIANVFLMQEKIEQTLTFYDKVVDILYKFLTGLKGHQNLDEFLDEGEVRQAEEMLKTILDSRGKYLGRQHIATGEANYVLGLLKQLSGDIQSAEQLCQDALTIYELQVGTRHDLSIEIAECLKAMGHSRAEQLRKELPPQTNMNPQ